MSVEINIGGFRVGRIIGQGAQGFVCEALCGSVVRLQVGGYARELSEGKAVALKIRKIHLPPDDPQYEDEAGWVKLKRRIEGLSRLDHPSVVRYYGAFSEIADLKGVDGKCRVHVVVMELLRGKTLEERLRNSPKGLDADEALSVAQYAAAGLAYTCKHGVIHRDIKPANIFVCEDGSVRIIDFGLAAQDNMTQSTVAGGLKGTLNYMAPDFLDADFGGDEKSDVFSFGVTMHELLTGSLPYDKLFGTSGEETLAAWFARWTAVRDGAESPVVVYPIIDKTLKGMSEIVAKCLMVRLADRAVTFAEISRELEKVAYVELSNGSRTYRYLKRIGAGGFGEVYKALDVNTDEVIAIKRLSDMASASRFQREAKTMQRLQDRDGCFVRLVDYFVLGESEGFASPNAFLAMEFLDGMPGNALNEAIVEARKRGERLDRLAVLLVFERYARGLAIMHGQGIIHRDIKPANLYYAEGRPESAKIMDYGIVRDEADPTMTTEGAIMPCTLEYAPPEAILDHSSRGTPKMDIYALGLSLYEALTGERAYPPLPSGKLQRMAQCMNRVRNREKPSFKALEPVQDQALLRLLRDMTEFDSGKRLDSAETVAFRLREILQAYTAPTGGTQPFITDATVALSRKEAERIWRQYHPVTDDPDTITQKERPVKIKPYQDPKPLLKWMVWCMSAVSAFLIGAIAVIWHDPTVIGIVQKTDVGTVRLPGGLPSDVSCRFDEMPMTNADVALSVELGTHDYAYSREGFEDQSFRVRLTSKRPDVTLEAPDSNAWRAVSVAVDLPDLPSDVSCVFHDRVVHESFSVAPGRHQAVYRRADCREQEIQFVASPSSRRTVLPPPGEWEFERVELKLPNLSPDVSCVFGGGAFREGVRVSPGDHKCLYARRGYANQELAFTIGTESRTFTLPPPGEWTVLPVEVRVPPLGEGVVCVLSGKRVAGGDARELKPGVHVWSYERQFYVAQTNTLSIRIGDEMKTLPPPEAWKPAPVAVRVPPLATGIVCTACGEKRKGDTTFHVVPGEYEWEYERPGFFPKSGKFTVELGKPCTLPPPPEVPLVPDGAATPYSGALPSRMQSGSNAKWIVKPIRVIVPSLEPEPETWCRIDNRLVPGKDTLLLPGRHESVYGRDGYVPQTNAFTLVLGDVEYTLPEPRQWVRLPSAARPPEIIDAVERYENAREWDSDEDWASVPPLFVAGVRKGYVLTAEERRMAFEAMARWGRDISAKEASTRAALEMGRELVFDPKDLARQRALFNECAKVLGWKPTRRD